jgi:hypothetical protein
MGIPVITLALLLVSAAQCHADENLRAGRALKSSKKIGKEILGHTLGDSFAPIYMQSVESTNYLDLLFKKYGMLNTEKARPLSQKALKALKKKNDAAGMQYWIKASITEGDKCDGTEYMIAGAILNQCMPMFGSGVVLTCEEGNIAYHKFSDEECSEQPVSSVNIAQEGCGLPSQEVINAWWSFDDDYYKKSVSIQCVTKSDPETNMGNGQYDMWKVYSTSDGTCDEKNFILYEAYALDTCIPIQVFYTRKDDASAQFKHDEKTGDMYATIYTGERDCSGDSTQESFSTSCSAGGNAHGSYQWTYYPGDK